MNSAPSVIGILLNYRDAMRSQRCIDSLLREGAEHVVVWDNSEDSGVTAARIRDANPDNGAIHLVVSDQNIGFAAAVNRAIEVAQQIDPEAFLLLINDDATLRPGALQELRQTLLDHPKAKLAVPMISHAGEVRSKAYYQRSTGLHFWRPEPDCWTVPPGCFSYPCGCCLMLAPNRCPLPLFDEAFFMYGEDWELGSRLADTDVVYLDRTLVDHEGSASSGLGTPFYEDRMVAAHLILAQKIAKSRLQYLFYLVGRAFVLPVRALVRACRHHSLVPLKALWHGLLISVGQRQ